MIEHEYWQDHLIWERDNAIVDICTKYFTFQDCAAVAFVIRQYLKQLLGDKFTSRQGDINANMFITKFKNNVEVYSALGPNSFKGISNGGGGYGRYGKNGFAAKYKEHFHMFSTENWALYMREKKYYEDFGIASWEDPNYPQVKPKKKTGPKPKKKNADGVELQGGGG